MGDNTLREEVKNAITAELRGLGGIDKSGTIADVVFRVLKIPESTQALPRNKAILSTTYFVVFNRSVGR